MVSFISKFLFTATVTAPTFLSLGLIGVIKDSTNYYRKHSVNHVFFPQTSVINFTSKKQSYDDTRRSSRDNELLQRAQSDL